MSEIHKRISGILGCTTITNERYRALVDYCQSLQGGEPEKGIDKDYRDRLDRVATMLVAAEWANPSKSSCLMLHEYVEHAIDLLEVIDDCLEKRCE